MKYILLITCLLSSIFVKAQGFYGFANSGMESWTNNTTITDWSLQGGSVTRVDHVKNGAFGAGVKNETASAGKLVASFAFTKRVARALFDYKFTLGTPTSSDTGMVEILLTRWNTSNGSREVIARIVRTSIVSDNSWQTFSFPFTYFNTTLDPDTCTIIVSASVNKGYNNATAMNVDNFAFPAPSGISATAKSNTTGIYPNPVRNNATITYELKKDSKVTINISDVTGKVVASYNFEKSAGLQQEQINFEALKSGIYFYEIKTSEEVKTGKFTISK